MGKFVGSTGLTYLWEKIKTIFATKDELEDVVAIGDDDGTGGIAYSGTSLTPIMNHESSETIVEIAPNILHVWQVIPNLEITLATPSDTSVVNLYMLTFASGDTPTTLSLPSFVQWPKKAPLTTIEANTVYEISIRDNKATWNRWEVVV